MALSSHTQAETSPPASATSQTSFNFHLLRNVVRGGHEAIFRNLIFLSVGFVDSLCCRIVSSSWADRVSFEDKLSKYSAASSSLSITVLN